jgi:hypothetical protein
MRKSLLASMAIMILIVSMLSGCSWSIGSGEKSHDQGVQGAPGPSGAQGAPGAPGPQGVQGEPSNK